MDYVGQQLGNYRLIRLLGRGAFADVYLGQHLHLDTQVAIKVLRTQISPEDLEQFRQEARILVQLEHPHIVRVLDFNVENDIPFFVMSYAHNGTLRKRYPKNTQLELADIISYVKQIAPALQYAHYRKIIHRDIKPENLLLGQHHEVLLSDFGIATLSHSTQSLSTQEQAGTSHYMAPEQIRGKPSFASDQYALGIVVYEWLCGAHPFDGSSHIEIAMKHLTDPPSPLRDRRPSIPLSIEQVVMKALAKNPKDRFESVQSFAKALTHASQQSPSLLAYSPPTTQQNEVPQDQSQNPTIPVTYGYNFKAKVEANRLLQAAHSQQQQGLLDEAAATYSKVLQRDQSNPIVWQEYGLLEGQRLRDKEALASFDRALQLDRSLAISWNGKGSALCNLHRFQEALDAFDNALKLEPENIFTWNGKGVALNALDHPNLALEAFNMALRFNPQMVQAWDNKGLVLKQQKRYREALTAFESALTHEPNSFSYWSRKGAVLYEMGQLGKALQAYQEAVNRNPKYAPAWCGMGNVHYQQQNFNEAFNAYVQTTDCDPLFKEAWYKRGDILSEWGSYTNALKSYEKALQVDPNYADALNGLASILCRLERYPEALQAYEKTLSINPNMALAWNGKGNTYHYIKAYAKALDAYEHALQLYPKLVSGWYNKSLTLTYLGRYEEALVAAEAAIRLMPTDPDNWDLKAKALRKLHRRAEAISAEVEVARLRGTSR